MERLLYNQVYYSSSEVINFHFQASIVRNVTPTLHALPTSVDSVIEN